LDTSNEGSGTDAGAMEAAEASDGLKMPTSEADLSAKWSWPTFSVLFSTAISASADWTDSRAVLSPETWRCGDEKKRLSAKTKTRNKSRIKTEKF
jgi:hypothetical protein